MTPCRLVNNYRLSKDCTAFYFSVKPSKNNILGTLILLLLLLLLLLTAIGLSPGGSGYFTCMQNTKLVTNKFKSGELHEKHVVNKPKNLGCWKT